MTDQPDIIWKLKANLEPFIKPREQVNYIRRILALHLGTCSGDGPIQHPLALADSSQEVVIPSDLSGPFREYVEALQANVAAHRRLDSVLHFKSSQPIEPVKQISGNGDILEEKICLLKLQRKRERLHAVRQSLDLIMEKPAATEDFLDIKQVFQGCAPLPNVPDDVMNGLVVEQNSPRAGLGEQIHELEKTVLRAKLLLKQEEQRLREARARSNGDQEVVSQASRLAALEATRNELISWIERELGNASQGENADERQSKSHASKASTSTMARLGEISKKYAQYVSARRLLLEMGSQTSQLSQSSKSTLLPPAQLVPLRDRSGSNPAPPPPQMDYLLMPYLEALAATSAKQKAMIGQKSFVSSVLGKQSLEACQVLGRLGEESHLLPAYPMKDSLRRRSGIQTEIASRSSEQPDIAKRIKPWVFAADSAKIALLEYVAETVDVGQVALENSMSNLREIDKLLGRTERDNAARQSEENAHDKMVPGRADGRHQAGKQSISGEKRDIWSKIHGNLGQDDTV